MKDLLLKLTAHLRAMQLYYHSAHHHSSRVAFFSDHGAFSDFYQELDDQYDSAAERLIGNYGQDALNLQVLMSLVTPKLQMCPSNTAKDNSDLFNYGLQMEQQLLLEVENLCKSPECSESDKQLISEFGNQAKSRVYKIKQRIKK